ncbi:prolyl oligopeptidase family serine peptidase [Vagococcus hydrophili]|uniref:Prolyl oligopeptidase family serine peptidase n=1 Tax=Vagococcus hydrophili TaxID=2714947 RepID=A0A6G8AQB5_9ENTE|nr:prolyl oligopeptidase family serine peptidase [Vagococcus hydrophili]QIL47132.1 prolyl oligopeptidase family serine peptidase [Vagococcus hydrophili]
MTLTIRKRMIQHIPVLEVVPTEFLNEPLSLVIYYHGWQTKKELALTASKKIAQENIRVILPDSMYHGERKIENRSMIPSFVFWSTLQYNLSEFPMIKNFYQKRGLIQEDNLGVAGFSMGGMTTAALLTRYPEIKVAAILMGSPNFESFISRTAAYIQKEEGHYPDYLVDLFSWTKTYDLSKMPEKIAGRPLYFWHGTDDQKLPYDVTYQFYRDHKDQVYGRQMSFETGEGEPHILTIDIMNKTGKFFVQHFSD